MPCRTTRRNDPDSPLHVGRLRLRTFSVVLFAVPDTDNSRSKSSRVKEIRLDKDGFLTLSEKRIASQPDSASVAPAPPPNRSTLETRRVCTSDHYLAGWFLVDSFSLRPHSGTVPFRLLGFRSRFACLPSGKRAVMKRRFWRFTKRNPPDAECNSNYSSAGISFKRN
jgi:hypothetical protein